MRKKKSVFLSDQEVVLLLKAYQLHPCSWDKIIDHIKTKVDSLPDDANRLYEQATSKQLKSRISTKFAKLMATKREKIANELIR